MAYAANDTDDEWRNLALAAQSGDKKAYNALLKEIFPYIRNVLMKALSDQDGAEDVAQEVLISVHKSLKTYSADRPFKPWLYAIINFRKMDYLRKYYSARKNQEAPLEYADFSEGGVTKPGLEGELKDVEKALQSLPDQQRKIFTMMKIEGYSAQEVANEMQMNVSAVKVSAHRTGKKLKDILK